MVREAWVRGMSGREWAPGDVAMVDYRLHRAAAVNLPGVRYSTGWIVVDRRGVWANIGDGDVTLARPLVVIDPEDWAAAGALAASFVECRSNIAGNASAMQAALRSLVTPPKPDEPQNDGAVVEDADGIRWVRTSPIVSSHLNDWVRSSSPHHQGSDRRHWDGIAAVKVLSEGVTP